MPAALLFVGCAGESTPAIPGSTNNGTEGRVSSAIAHSCQKAVQTEDSESDPLEGVSPAELMDAQSYANDFDVSLGEALVRLQGQGVIGRLGSEIETLEPDTYAGHWIQHEPQYRIVVAFTMDGENTICPFIEGHPLFDIVEVRSAVATMVELDRSHMEAMDVASELGIQAESSINVFQNVVELYVMDSGQLDSALEKAGLSLPVHVRVIEVSSFSAPASPASGGQ